MRVSLEIDIPNPDDDRPGVLLRFPYDAEFIEELKDAVRPARDRGFKPALEGWWVAEAHRETAEQLLADRFGSYAVLGEYGGDYVVNSDGSRIGQGGLFE